MGRPEKKISEFDVRLGAVVRSQRGKAKLGQEAMAKATGIAMSSYRRRETGENEITVSELERIATVLNPLLPQGTSPQKLAEEALSDYGGIDKLIAEHTQKSDPPATVTAEDNVTYLGRVTPPLDAAADENPRK